MLNPWVGKIPWRRNWQPTSIFLSGKSHGQRNLAGCSPWGYKELDMTEQEHARMHSLLIRLAMTKIPFLAIHSFRFRTWSPLKCENREKRKFH